RRRHTRSKRDWSSDVCSSDLPTATSGGLVTARKAAISHTRSSRGANRGKEVSMSPTKAAKSTTATNKKRALLTDEERAAMKELRSEERRVGKEWRDE